MQISLLSLVIAGIDAAQTNCIMWSTRDAALSPITTGKSFFWTGFLVLLHRPVPRPHSLEAKCVMCSFAES